MKNSEHKNPEISFIKESWLQILAQKKNDLIRNSGTTDNGRLIAVFGGSAVKEGSRDWKDSFNVGVELAKRGAIVYNGAYGGVMEASAMGARSVGGATVGVTCRNLPTGPHNQYIQHEWALDRWDQRLLALVFLADGYLVMHGSSGTLVELSVTLETQFKGFIPVRPIVCFGKYWRDVVKRIDGTDGIVNYEKSPEKVAEILTVG